MRSIVEITVPKLISMAMISLTAIMIVLYKFAAPSLIAIGITIPVVIILLLSENKK